MGRPLPVSGQTPGFRAADFAVSPHHVTGAVVRGDWLTFTVETPWLTFTCEVTHNHGAFEGRIREMSGDPWEKPFLDYLTFSKGFQQRIASLLKEQSNNG